MFNGSQQNSAPASKSVLKNPLLYSTIAVLITIVVVGWILFSRWQQNRQIDRQTAQERAQQQHESDRAALDQLGGKDLAIQALYANPGIVARGESAQLCYGVANAKTVTLQPQSNPFWPSHARCVEVTPKKDTVYTLTAEDASGNKTSQQIEIKVR
jgi:type II secretory pathway pseudopilin PulG